MRDFWNHRYAEEGFAYGQLPNAYFKQELDKLPVGSILLPAEGEGRNAIYALKKGWHVHAFDFSPSAMIKALEFANDEKLPLQYEVSDVLSFSSDKTYDVLALCYAHFPANIRKEAHKHLLRYLKPNGTIIFEAFAKSQLGNLSGGPKNIDMLFSIEEIKKEFNGIAFNHLTETKVELNEGKYHQGEASVIRFTGKK
ncbi:class I SAM-dependent methyltransferase [Maribacter sp. CXY002]|uniref:class I SAM-dependent methyltransferase n=1 Tax=Maribacter luteocoastalis TaxID=3407671 RepID=UPI003B67C13F